jgi:two-component sensor histidine kinase
MAVELKRELAEVKQERLLMRKFEWLVTQAPGFIAIVDTQGYATYLNGYARNVVGLKPDESIPAGVEFVIEPEDHGTFQDDVMPLVRQNGGQQFKLRLRNSEGGDPVRALFTMFALHNAEGRKIGYGLWAENIEQQEADREYQWTLKREAIHRLQNTLTVTASLVAQTLRTMTTPEDAIAVIRGRLSALGQAIEVLKAEIHARADIAEVVRLAVAAHDPGGDRIRISGSSCQIERQHVQALSLALHELATNATKYGALTTERGQIQISWTIGRNRSFQLEWKENGGPAVDKPTPKGFGSRLIRQTGTLFSGTAETEYRPEGIRFVLMGKLPES